MYLVCAVCFGCLLYQCFMLLTFVVVGVGTSACCRPSVCRLKDAKNPTYFYLLGVQIHRSKFIEHLTFIRLDPRHGFGKP